MVRQIERDILKEYVIGEGIDAGCGNFKIGKFGIDIDEHGDADLICNLWAIPLESSSKDYIISCHSLEHTEKTIDTLKEWYRLLKDGGILAIATPNGEIIDTTTLGDSEGTHKQIFTRITLEKFLIYCGFKIIKSSIIYQIPDNSILIIAQK